jgi:membrane-associated phospholipid phosphatase
VARVPLATRARRPLGRRLRAAALAFATVGGTTLLAPAAPLQSQRRPAPVGATVVAPAPVTVSDRAIARTAVVALAAAVVMPADEATSRWLSSSPVADAPGVAALAATGRVWGFAGALALGPVTWAAGALGDDADLARTGRRTAESVLLTLAATGAIKVVAGRTRPDRSPDGSARHWRLMRGLRDDGHRSFPSGHASLATAAAITFAHGLRSGGTAGWRDGAAIGGWALAGTAILSRVRDRRHWLSDVLAGAALGSAGALVARRW